MLAHFNARDSVMKASSTWGTAEMVLKLCEEARELARLLPPHLVSPPLAVPSRQKQRIHGYHAPVGGVCVGARARARTYALRDSLLDKQN
jgi:hypothetical protein